MDGTGRDETRAAGENPEHWRRKAEVQKPGGAVGAVRQERGVSERVRGTA